MPAKKPGKTTKAKKARKPTPTLSARQGLKLLRDVRETIDEAIRARDDAEESLEQMRKSWEKERNRADSMIPHLAEANLRASKMELLINNTQAVTPAKLKAAFLAALREAGLAKET